MLSLDTLETVDQIFVIGGRLQIPSGAGHQPVLEGRERGPQTKAFVVGQGRKQREEKSKISLFYIYVLYLVRAVLPDT